MQKLTEEQIADYLIGSDDEEMKINRNGLKKLLKKIIDELDK